MSSTWEPAHFLPPAGSLPLLCEGWAGLLCRGRPSAADARPPGGRLAVGRALGPHLSFAPPPPPCTSVYTGLALGGQAGLDPTLPDRHCEG